MSDTPVENRHEPEISFNGDGTEVPLWLLQKDESRFLYVSFLLSVTVHVIAFLIMAATRIFHPYAGASHQFDLVWLSPAPMQAAAPKSSAPAKAKKHVTAKVSAGKMQSPRAKAATAKPKPPPAPQKSPSVEKTAKAPLVTPSKPAPVETPPDEPAEMVIPRYGGKVVDIVEHKEDIPTFAVISSVKLKSMTARAVVHTIEETEKKPSKPRETKKEITTPVRESSDSEAKPTAAEKTVKPVKAASVPDNPPGENKGKSSAEAVPVQGAPTSATRTGTDTRAVAAYPSVNRSINSFAAAIGALASSAGKPAEKAAAVPGHAGATAGSEKTAAIGTAGHEPGGPGKSSSAHGSPGKSPTDAPAHVESPAPSNAIKKTPQPPEKPKLVLHPPLVGDLKLIITSDVDLKVEAVFRAYPKNRRSKPLTRWESKTRHGVQPKMVRTGEKVHEAVVEITQEGIYDIMVTANNGKPVTAKLILKIRESRPGASTKDLGTRTITGSTEVARVLMPEGILWEDDSYFTGNMEDSDSVTKFHAGTGLMWKEYK